MERADKVQGKLAFKTSMGLSVVYLIMFGFYAYAFWFGGLLRWTPEAWAINDFTDERYTGGEIMGIMFSIMFGIFQLAAVGPMLKAVTEGKIAGKLAYDVIDHVPEVKVNQPNCRVIPNDGSFKGHIEFRDVSFTYPTR